MTIWLPDLPAHHGPKYLAIADALAEAITSGTLPAGSKLPPQRNLAYDLGVTLGTVTRAYREAERRGLVGGEVGRGTFVNGGAPKRGDGFIEIDPEEGSNVLDLTHATLPHAEAGVALQRLLAALSQEPDLTPLIDYQLSTGLPRHLDAGAKWVAARGVATSRRNMAISGGVQHGTLAAFMALAASGETLLVEELTYPGTIRLAQHMGLRLEPVAMDAEGFRPDALDAACRRTTGRLMYCMPSVHNPTTATMSIERRQAIAEVARRHNLHIVEDNVWPAVAPDTPPPLATFAPERTIFISGPAKCMAGGLRIGFVHCPDALIDRVRSAIRVTSWMAAPLMAEITTRWMEDGTGQRLTDVIHREIVARVAIARKHLGHLTMRSDDNVPFVWLELPPPWRAADFRAEAEARGIRVLTAETFTPGREAAPHAARISVGGNISRAEVNRAMATLADILKGQPGTASSVI